MNADVQWWGWLMTGMALGLAAAGARSGLSGLFLIVAILASPLAIFMTAGAKPMPFVLFYGGLVTVSSLLYRRKNAQEDAKRRDQIEAKKKQNLGR